MRVEGTTLETQTDAQGQFSIASAPVGHIVLHADGTTAQRPGTWPSLEYELVTIPGQNNTIGMPVYLLPLDIPNGLFVDETTGGTLTLPQLPGFSLTVAANSATFPGGSTSGVVSVTLVHPDKIPMTPNFGQQPRFIITIQPAGVLFDPPAPLTIPNLDGLVPGEVTELYSFDHDMGQFVAIGTGAVSEDGTVVASDQGVGIIEGGWHCGGNPAPSGSAGTCEECKKVNGILCEADPGQNGNDCNDENECTISDACLNGECEGQPVPDEDENGDPRTCQSDDEAVCTQGVCVDGSCDEEPVPNFPPVSCNDGNQCTEDDRCQAGACAGDEKPPDTSCVNECTLPDTAKCEPDPGGGGPVCKGEEDPAQNGEACNDQNACTTGTKCGAGVCAGGTNVEISRLQASANGQRTLFVPVGTPVNFTAFATHTGCQTVEFAWDFGDGSGTVGQNATHSYSTIGQFLVTLEAQCLGDGANKCDTEHDTLVVKVVELEIFDVTTDGPGNSFLAPDYSSSSGLGQNITLNARVNGDPSLDAQIKWFVFGINGASGDGIPVGPDTGPVFSFQPSPVLPFGGGSEEKSDPLGYEVEAQIDLGTGATFLTDEVPPLDPIIQDPIDTIRQEYAAHRVDLFPGLEIPGRIKFSEKTQAFTDNFQLNPTNPISKFTETEYDFLIFGFMGATAEAMRTSFNEALAAQGISIPPGGFNLVITSGYRNPERNESFNGEPNSRHQFGDALDLRSELLSIGQLDLIDLFQILEPLGDQIADRAFCERSGTGQVDCDGTQGAITHLHMQGFVPTP